MRWILAVVIVVVGVVSHGGMARASTVGVVITGDPAIQARLSATAAHYLEQHGHKVATGALDPTALSNLFDCLAIDDDKCAQAVIEKRAKTDVVLAIRPEVGKGEPREVHLVAYWIAKGHSPVAMRRVCEKCSDAALDSMFDAVLVDLVKQSASGRLILKSKPSNLLAVLDNQPIGSTPLERDVPVGQHALALVENGKTVAQRWISIAADERAELTMSADRPRGPSRVLPVVALGVGIAAAITGGVLFGTSQSPTGQHPTYRDTKALGLGVALGGAAVLAGTGVWLLLRNGASGPTIAVTGSGAAAGWIGSF